MRAFLAICKSIRRSAIAPAISAAIVLASNAAAHAWDAAKASTNLSVPALSDAELGTRKIERVEMGELELPTGEIVASDPLAQPERPAFARKVQPGKYPVTLYLFMGRPALAMVRFAPGNPSKWEIATTPEQDAATLKDDEIFGYPVDAGTGSFRDVTALKLMDERERREIAAGAKNFNYYDDVLADEYDVYVMHRPIPENSLNIAVFQSGWGDGFYATFWGLDAAGKPLVLMTDFQTLENGDGRSAYELANAAAIAAMTDADRAAVKDALQAIKADDTARLGQLLRSGAVKPESYVAETGASLTFETIRHVRARALELMAAHGAPLAIPAGMSTVEYKTYPDFARAMEKYSAPGPEIAAMMDVVKRWDAGAIARAP